MNVQEVTADALRVLEKKLLPYLVVVVSTSTLTYFGLKFSSAVPYGDGNRLESLECRMNDLQKRYKSDLELMQTAANDRLATAAEWQVTNPDWKVVAAEWKAAAAEWKAAAVARQEILDKFAALEKK